MGFRRLCSHLWRILLWLFAPGLALASVLPLARALTLAPAPALVLAVVLLVLLLLLLVVEKGDDLEPGAIVRVCLR